MEPQEIMKEFTNSDTRIGVKLDNSFHAQLEQHQPLFDPVSKLVFRVSGTWISGDEAYSEVRAIGFFTNLLEALVSLDDGSEKEHLRLHSDTYLSFSRSGDDVTVGKWYSETAIENTDERLGIEPEATTRLEVLIDATVKGAEEVHDRVVDTRGTAGDEKVRTLREGIEQASKRIENC